MSVRKTTTDVASSSVGTKAQGAGVNQEKGQNQMTREKTELAGAIERLTDAYRLAEMPPSYDRTNVRASDLRLILSALSAAPPPSVEVFGSSPDGDTPRVAETAVVGDLIRELVEACQPIAEKARRWDERHGSSRRDSVQIEHRIGDFRRIRDLLDHKSCADGAPR